MADLRHLYQDTLLEHYRAPRHAEPLVHPDAHATRHNPRCGDACDAALSIEDQRISNISLASRGCTVAVASGSILAELCAGMSIVDARKTLVRARALITGESRAGSDDSPSLAALATVSDYPTRHQCALLATEALALALDALSDP
jgi:nitrogen fixation NifU-like protein